MTTALFLSQPKDTWVAEHPEVVWLPETTWGDGAGQHTWINNETHWMWKHIHQCETHYFHLKTKVREHSTKTNKKLLDELKWELLMLQASDWPFVISTRGAVDYGYRRFCQHLERFNAIHDCLSSKLCNQQWTEIQKAKRKEPTPSIWRAALYNRLAAYVSRDRCFTTTRLVSLRVSTLKPDPIVFFPTNG